MKIIFNSILFLLLAQLGIAQTLLALARPMDKREWGFVNLKGEFISEPVYRKVSVFSKDGFAPAFDEKSGKFIFVNTKGGKLNTDLDFVPIGSSGINLTGFSDGMAPVKLQGRWGYMNVQGKIAIKAIYDKVTEFNGGYASVEREGKQMIIDLSGQETVVTDPRVAALKPFKNGFAPFDSKERKSGFVDHTGKVVVEPVYGSVGYFNAGLAWARSTINGDLGYINITGEWVIQPQFFMTRDFDVVSGLARVKTDKWSYVDKTGKFLNVSDTENFEDFSEGLCSGRKGGKFGFYDNTGKWIIQPQFDGLRDFKNGYAAAKMGDKWGLIDTSGKWIIQPNLAVIKDMELAD